MADDRSTEAIRAGQIQRLIYLGFPKRLGLSHDEYKARFPAVESVPLPRAGHFDLLVAVDPLVDLGFQHQAVGIKEAVTAARLGRPGRPPCFYRQSCLGALQVGTTARRPSIPTRTVIQRSLVRAG